MGNPFIFHSSIKPKYFRGRTTEVRDIIYGVTQDTQRNFLITGGYKIGKSSLIDFIKHKISEDHAHNLKIIKIDPYPSETPKDFFYRCSQRLAEELQINCNIPISVIDKKPDDILNGMQRYISSYLKEKEDTSIVFFIENIHRFYEGSVETKDTEKAKAIKQETINWLDYILDGLRNYPISFIISLRLLESADLDQDGIVASKNIHCQKIPLSAFSKKEVEDLVSGPSTSNMLVRDKGLQKYILDKAGNHPLIIQYIMSRLYGYHTYDSLEVTFEDVKNAVEEFRYEEVIWQWFSSIKTPLEEQIFSLIVNLGKIKESTIRMKFDHYVLKDVIIILEYLKSLGFINDKALSDEPPTLATVSSQNERADREWEFVAGDIIKERWLYYVSNLIQPSPKEKPSDPTEKTVMTEPIFSWLHISDLHLGYIDSYRSWVKLKEAFINDLKENCSNSAITDERLSGVIYNPNAIFITGDIVYSGKKHEYKLASELLNAIWEITGLGPDRTFVVPGNHDVNRTVVETNAVHKLAYSNLASTDLSKESWIAALQEWWDSKELQRLFRKKFANFISFAKECTSNRHGNLFYSNIFLVNERKIAILGVNSALISWEAKEDYKRGLWIGRPQVEELVSELKGKGVSLVICLVHHPEKALHNNDSSWEYLQSKCKIILHGHTHNLKVIPLLEPEHELYCIPGGSVSSDKGIWKSQRYSYGQINLVTGELNVWMRMTKIGETPLYIRDNHTYPQHAPDGHINVKIKKNR